MAVRALLLAEHAPPDESYPSFLVVGDWGRQGRHNQSVVAAAMARTAAARHLPLSFVVSTGDNFYESGLSSAEDPQFAESFADVYWQPSLQASRSRTGPYSLARRGRAAQPARRARPLVSQQRCARAAGAVACCVRKPRLRRGLGRTAPDLPGGLPRQGPMLLGPCAPGATQRARSALGWCFLTRAVRARWPRPRREESAARLPTQPACPCLPTSPLPAAGAPADGARRALALRAPVHADAGRRRRAVIFHRHEPLSTKVPQDRVGVQQG